MEDGRVSRAYFSERRYKASVDKFISKNFEAAREEEESTRGREIERPKKRRGKRTRTRTRRRRRTRRKSIQRKAALADLHNSLESRME